MQEIWQLNSNGKQYTYTAQQASKDFIASYDQYAKSLDETIKLWGLSPQLKAQALMPFDEQYYTALYMNTDNEELKAQYQQKIQEARRIALEQVFAPNSIWAQELIPNLPQPKTPSALSWLNYYGNYGNNAQLFQFPLYQPNQSGYVGKYNVNNAQQPPIKTYAVNLGGITITNLNGELNPEAIKGLGTYVQQQVEKSLVSIANQNVG